MCVWLLFGHGHTARKECAIKTGISVCRFILELEAVKVEDLEFVSEK
jgi:hypothetical protein